MISINIKLFSDGSYANIYLLSYKIEINLSLLYKGMVFIYTVALSLASILLIYQNHSIYISLTTVLFSFLYYFRLWMQEQNKFAAIVSNGELFHQIAYLAWMLFFPQQDFVFFVPLMLSNVGKIYAIFHEKDDDNQTTIQQLIKFQVKLEFLISIMLLIKLLHPSLVGLLEFISFIILCKIKYTFYFPAQKAYVELHFLLDSITKRWRIRRFYHMIHNFIAFFGAARNDTKEIAY